MRRSILLALALATTGCVKASTHRRTVDQLTAAQATLDRRDARIRELEGSQARLQGEQEASDAELAELREKRAADEQRLAAYQDLQSRFKSMVDTGELEVTFRRGQMTLKLPSGVLFPSAGADLGDAGKKTLTKVTALLMPLKDRRFSRLLK